MKLRTIIVTATTAAVLASTGVAIAGATGNSSSTASPATPPAVSAPAAAAPPTAAPDGVFATRVHARRLRLRRMLRGAGDVVTKAIGIDRATLRQGLASGETIAQIATDNHVAPQAVIDALVAAAKTKLEAAVSAGKLTSERAAKIEARLPARVTNLVDNWHPKRLRNTPVS